MKKIAKVKVKDVMEKTLVLVKPETTLDKAAKAMRKKKAVCAVVIEKKRPIGIITESDVLEKVVAKNKKPSGVKIKEIMSSPIIAIDPGLDALEAARLMIKKHHRQIPVVKDGKLIGLLHARNIVGISPEIVDILEEYLKTRPPIEVPPESESTEGYCELCGEWDDFLKEVQGKLICSRCKESMS